MITDAAAPGAPAVILFKEEDAEDTINMHSTYVRLKILGEAGKKYADVDIPFEGRRFQITDIQGRTIHADGSVVPFAGKPYEKTLYRKDKFAYKAKVFTLPDVQVGSILEYRYKLRYEDNYHVPPQWYVQSALYVHKAHYRFTPYQGDLQNARGQLTNGQLAYLVNLPDHRQKLPPDSRGNYDFTVTDIPALPDEPFLPPTRSFSYRVMFYYSPYSTAAEFWKSEGKFWSKDIDRFAGTSSKTKAEVEQLAVPGGTPEQNLRKIYAEIMSMENTHYTHHRDEDEDKAAGLKTIKNDEDILTRRRGTADELTMLFIGLARSAGFKAYGMAVTNRDLNLFSQSYLDMGQLDDLLAIVEVDGKDRFFDPGCKYCGFGELHWKHTSASGVREVRDGIEFATTPDLNYKQTVVKRIAQITLADDGTVNGPARLVYSGQEALLIRQAEVDHDNDEVKKDLEDQLRDLLPGGMTVSMSKVTNLTDGEKDLVIDYMVHGPIATATSKRVFLPGQLFEVNSKQPFTAATRTNMVYFDYPYSRIDLVELTLPSSIKPETVPGEQRSSLPNFGLYATKAAYSGSKLTVRREFVLAGGLEPASDYDKLRTFFGEIRNSDENQLLLARASSNVE